MPNLTNSSVAIIGLGLIGGSIARALKVRVPGVTLFASDINQNNLDLAVSEGVIDRTGDLNECVKDADIIILALPPLLVAETIPLLPNLVNEHAVITDVASVKNVVNEALNTTPKDFQSRFVLGHPIAGSEKSGYHAASESLFLDRNIILTPSKEVLSSSVAKINELWRLLGANILGLNLERHDSILAATSHLPHLLAYSLVDVLVEQNKGGDIFRYAAGGFADFSRLASSNPIMWADIFISNAVKTEQILDTYIHKLLEFKELIKAENRSELMSKFSAAKISRDNFIENLYKSNETNENHMRTINYSVEPSKKIEGSIKVPGDKSISHRGIIFGSIADGITEINGFLEGEDTLKTLAAFQEMGVTIIGPDKGRVIIYGVGVDGLRPPRESLYMGNSGTAMRLVAGVLAGQKFESQLSGDESLSKRPMKRIVDPLREFGAEIKMASGGNPPLHINGAKLNGKHYDMKVASAQVKSCLLIAGVYATGKTSITEPTPSRDHTERMLRAFGYPVTRDDESGKISIEGGGNLVGTKIDVPADISSAAFFMVAAAISQSGEVKLRDVGINPTRTGILSLLNLMGVDIEISNRREIGGEPVGDITVRSSNIKAITVPKELVPLAIDEFPVFCVAAACAEGTTILRGAEELRVKESDRIESMALGLRNLGISVRTFSDGMEIEGGVIRGGQVDSYSDHRVAMAFAVSSVRANDKVLIKNCANVGTSFPGFVSLAASIGLNILEI